MVTTLLYWRFLNNAKSRKALLPLDFSTTPKMTKMTMAPTRRTHGIAVEKSSLLAWVTRMNTAAMPSAKVIAPAQSRPRTPLRGVWVSGARRTRMMPATLTSTPMRKMPRHPTKVCSSRPPKRLVTPEAPKLPSDHIEIARWRSVPSQYVRTNVRVAA